MICPTCNKPRLLKSEGKWFCPHIVFMSIIPCRYTASRTGLNMLYMDMAVIANSLIILMRIRRVVKSYKPDREEYPWFCFGSGNGRL